MLPQHKYLWHHMRVLPTHYPWHAVAGRRVARSIFLISAVQKFFEHSLCLQTTP